MIRPARKDDDEALIGIWASAVKATHDFLAPGDFEYYRSRIAGYFIAVDLYVYTDVGGTPKGFLGVADGKIEMLFVQKDSMGKGIGRELLGFAVNTLKADKLDVNEQNGHAVSFYLRFGFEIAGRSNLDGDGKNYPLLHLVRSGDAG